MLLGNYYKNNMEFFFYYDIDLGRLSVYTKLLSCLLFLH